MDDRRESKATSTGSLVPSLHEASDARRVSISHLRVAPRVVIVSEPLHVPKRRSSNSAIAEKYMSSYTRGTPAQGGTLKVRGEVVDSGNRASSALVDPDAQSDCYQPLLPGHRRKREAGIFRGTLSGERLTFEELWKRQKAKVTDDTAHHPKQQGHPRTRRVRRDTWIGKKALVQSYISDLQKLRLPLDEADVSTQPVYQRRFETEVSDQGFALIRKKSRGSPAHEEHRESEEILSLPRSDGGKISLDDLASTPRRPSVFNRVLSTLGSIRQTSTDGSISKASKEGFPPTVKSQGSASLATTGHRVNSEQSNGSLGSYQSHPSSLTDTIAAFPQPPTSATSVTQQSRSIMSTDFGINWEPEYEKLYAEIVATPGVSTLEYGDTVETWVAVEVRTRIYRPSEDARPEARRGIDMVLVVDLSSQTSASSAENAIFLIRYIYQSLRKEDRLAILVMSSFGGSSVSEPDELRLGIGLQPINPCKIEALLISLEGRVFDRRIEETDIARGVYTALKLFTDPELAKIPRIEEGRYLFSKHITVISASTRLEIEPTTQLEGIRVHHINPCLIPTNPPLSSAFVWTLNPFCCSSRHLAGESAASACIDEMLASMRSDQNLGRLEQLEVQVRPAPSCGILAVMGNASKVTLRPGELIRLLVKAQIGHSTVSRSSSYGFVKEHDESQSASQLLAELDAMLGEAVTDILSVEAEYSHCMLPPATRLVTRANATVKRALSHRTDDGSKFLSVSPLGGGRSPSIEQGSDRKPSRTVGQQISPTTIKYDLRCQSGIGGEEAATSPDGKNGSGFETEPGIKGQGATSPSASKTDGDILRRLAYFLAGALQPRQALCAIDDLTAQNEKTLRYCEDFDALRAELLHQIAIGQQLGRHEGSSKDDSSSMSRSISGDIVDFLAVSPRSLLYASEQQDQIDMLASPTCQRYHTPVPFEPPVLSYTPISQQRVSHGLRARTSNLNGSDEAVKIWKRLEAEAGGIMTYDSPGPRSSPRRREKSLTIQEFVKEVGKERDLQYEREKGDLVTSRSLSSRQHQRLTNRPAPLRPVDVEHIASTTNNSNVGYPYSSTNRVVRSSIPDT